jgi:hypothetical protein
VGAESCTDKRPSQVCDVWPVHWRNGLDHPVSCVMAGGGEGNGLQKGLNVLLVSRSWSADCRQDPIPASKGASHPAKFDRCSVGTLQGHTLAGHAGGCEQSEDSPVLQAGVSAVEKLDQLAVSPAFISMSLCLQALASRNNDGFSVQVRAPRFQDPVQGSTTVDHHLGENVGVLT